MIGQLDMPFHSFDMRNQIQKSLLQRKRHIEIELFVRLSVLRLFHVDHVVQNRRRVLSLTWREWARNERFTTPGSRCGQNLKYKNFTSLFGRLRQKIAPKSVRHVVQNDFSSFKKNFIYLCTVIADTVVFLKLANGRFYTRGRIIRLDELGQTFVMRLVIRL